MFIYQTKKLYNENGDGPFDALVITNDEQGAKPADVEQTVMALTQETSPDATLHDIGYYEEFVVGTAPEPAFYQATADDLPIFTKLNKNYVDTEHIALGPGDDLIDEDSAVKIFFEDDDIVRVLSNVSTITAKTSEGNDGKGYKLNVITELVESVNFYQVSVYYDAEDDKLPDDFYYKPSGSPAYTNVTLSLPNGSTYTIKFLAYVPE